MGEKKRKTTWIDKNEQGAHLASRSELTVEAGVGTGRTWSITERRGYSSNRAGNPLKGCKAEERP